MSLRSILTALFAAALLVGIATPALSDVPTYRHQAEIPASMSDRLKLAARYAEAPGRTLRAPSGPVVARQVVIGSTRFIVFSNAGRNSVRDIAETARRRTDCQVARNASFRTIRSGGIVPSGYAMPCAG